MSRGRLRIVAGSLRGRRIRVPAGSTMRPTAARAREALFNILGGRTRDAVVLDAFAGSGALGFESLSRGARHVVFIENDREAVRALAAAAEELAVAERCTIVPGRAEKRLGSPLARGPFDLVFADPPWGDECLAGFLRALEAKASLKRDGILVVEHRTGSPLPVEEQTYVSLYRTARYGDSQFSFLRREPGTGPD